jgi:hypothetical protein
MLQEEDIARQRAPLNNKVFAQLHQTAIASKCKDSISDLLFDVVALGCYIGPRLSEYAQTTQDEVNHQTYPSGKMVIKAFITNNFIFYNEKKLIVKDLNEDSFQRACFVKITWRIQKNCQNGQSITLAAESDQPEICPVCSMMQLVLWARWLNQPDGMPFAVYKTKKGEVIYLTGNKIAELLQKALKKVRPDTTPDELKQYSAHSLRVCACVLLNKAGKPPNYIKKRLCWLGDSFRMYLRDTAIIQHQHVDALLAASQEVIELIAALPKDVLALSTMTEGTGDPDMHKYTEKWTKRPLLHNDNYSFNFFIKYSSNKLSPQSADTSQPHLVTVPVCIKSAYRTCNNSIARSHLVPVQSPATHVDRVPTSWNSEFPRQDQIKANRTAPIVLIYCLIYRGPHQILQCYICGIPCML